MRNCGPASRHDPIARGASIVVAGDPPAGFAAVIALDGHPHLGLHDPGPSA